MLTFSVKTNVISSGPMEYAIEIQNLSKSYPGRMALNDVSFKVTKGSIHGFLGPNGAGKSTTMKIIAGLITQTSGQYIVRGKIGFLPEHPPVYGNMTVLDYLIFVQNIYAHNTHDRGKNIEIILTKTGLSHVKDRLIGNLSKGYQQRVGIAQALVGNAQIIILDEPTVGLDPVAIAEIRSLINELKMDHTILFSSHQLYDVESLCSEITLINHGNVIVSGNMDEILNGLKTNLNLSAKVKTFNDDNKQALIEKYQLHSLIASKKEDHWSLSIKTKSRRDQRAEISKELSELGLLEFTEDQVELEDLFKRL